MKKRIIFLPVFLLFFVLVYYFLFYSNYLYSDKPVAPKLFFSLEFVNEQILPNDLQFQDTRVGGLSALSYHPIRKTFFSLSDDSNTKQRHLKPRALKEKIGIPAPSRFYEMKLHQKTDDKKYELQLVDQVFLLDQNGKPLPIAIDPEGMVILGKNQILISSEGVQLPDLLAPPGIFAFNLKGQWEFAWPLHQMFWPRDLKRLGKWGVKRNKAFEALSLDPKQEYLWLGLESALHQDSWEQEQTKKQYIRISQYSVEGQEIIRQFVYPMDFFITKGNLAGYNGMTDFLSLGDKKFIVIERAYLKDAFASKENKASAQFIRLFLADCSSASDVLNHKNLQRDSFVACGKTKIMNLSDSLKIELDNIEGIAMGPQVAKGSYLLVLISDNNFRHTQKTQILFFHYKLKNQFYN